MSPELRSWIVLLFFCSYFKGGELMKFRDSGNFREYHQTGENKTEFLLP